MSWFRDSSLSWIQLCCVKLLKCGQIPQHIAFIMDGNRRYAKQNHVKNSDGHSKGFDKLTETLQWCVDLGTKNVTVYAFSIENFNRSKEEVDVLLDLAKTKFAKLLEEKDKLMEHGVRIRVIGKISLLPADLVKTIAEIELLTKDNRRATLNVAFAYTAREEMTQAIRDIVDGHHSSKLDVSDISVDLLSHCLYTRDSPSPDLLIRTSGEKRLSDFLLLQTAHSYLHFTDILWPDFSAWHLLYAVFQYQRAQPLLAQSAALASPAPLSDKARTFLQTIDDNHWRAATTAISL